MFGLYAEGKNTAINDHIAPFQGERSQGKITRLFIGSLSLNRNSFQINNSKSLKDNFLAQAYCQKLSNRCNNVPIKDIRFLEPFLKNTSLGHCISRLYLQKKIHEYTNLKELYVGATNIPDLQLLSNCRLNKIFLAKNTITNLDFLENQKLESLHLLGVELNPSIYDKDNKQPMFRTHYITKPDYTAALPKSCNIRYLKLVDIDFLDMNSLKNKHIEELSVNHCNFTTIDPLLNLPLRKLEIIKCPVRSLEKIDKIPLDELTLAAISPIKSLKDIENLKLKKLTLDECRLSDYSALKSLDKLQSLRIAFPSSRIVKKNIFTMELLSKMPLQELSLKKWRSDEMDFDLAALTGKKIKHLELEASSLINSHVLSSLSLESLYLKINVIDDALLEVITKMKNLRSLSIVGGKLNNEKLEKIASLPLTSLNISYNPQITSLSSLGNMSLQYLRINRTHVTDLVPLQKMPLAGIDIRFLKLDEASKKFINKNKSKLIVIK